VSDTLTKNGVDGVWAKLRGRKVVQWGVAYAAGAWGFLQGLEYVSEAFGWPSQIRQVAILALLIGLPITLVVAWYHGDRGDQRVGATELAIITLLFLMGGGIFWRYDRSNDRSPDPAVMTAAVQGRTGEVDGRPSVAVIPFANLTTDPEDDYLADGIAETLLTMLAQVSELRVIGRASSFSFKDQNEDARSIGEKLGVDALLAGSVQRAGNHIRVSARIVRTNDGAQVWAATFDRPASDIFAVQDEIATNVTKALSIALAGCAPQPAGETPPANTAATPAAAPMFVNRVWQVEKSPQIAPGALYTFFSDGVLVITSAGNLPLVGAWARRDSGLTMTEEGITYPVDLVELTAERFHIRIRGPGEPVEIEFVPAKGE